MDCLVNGVRLHYEKRGSGKPLLLLHGNGEDHHIFDRLAEKLEKHYTVYGIDSRNHGRSDRTEDFSYETMAEDIFCLMQELELGAVYLLGFSDGAILGLLLAMEHPEAIEKMALLGVNLTPEDFTQESYDFVKTTYAKTRDPLFLMMLEQPQIALEQVKGISIPVLLVAGEQDIFKPESFVRLEQALPQGRLLTLAGQDHDSYINGQGMLYPDLVAFFD